jgi:sugar lactone lactonase YvrE
MLPFDTPLVPLGDVRIHTDGLDHPEGVTTGPDGSVWAGGELGQVYRVDADAQDAHELGRSGTLALGIVVDGDGCAYTCNPYTRSVEVFSPTGEHRAYAQWPAGQEIVGCNHLVFDARGSLYVSGSGHGEVDDGRIYRVDPGGRAELWCEDLRTCPNGLCLDPEGRYLYVAMSFRPGRVSRVAIREDGSAGESEDYVVLDGLVPDGLAFAENGDLYVATYRPDAVLVVRAGTRAVEVLAHDPAGGVLASPTNVAFARHEDAPCLVVANIGRWHLARIPVEVRGAPLHHPVAPGLGF